jgi:hypothetical protein
MRELACIVLIIVISTAVVGIAWKLTEGPIDKIHATSPYNKRDVQYHVPSPDDNPTDGYGAIHDSLKQ